jgi:hypothetical protein
MVPNIRTSSRSDTVSPVGEVEGGVPVEQAVEGEQGLGAGGVQLGEVEQGRAAEGAGDVPVLPAALGPALAVAVERVDPIRVTSRTSPVRGIRK